MKTVINISGQISGNTRLANAIHAYDMQQERTMFNGYRMTFATKAAAKKALWDAYKRLRAAEPEFSGGIKYSRFGTLRYDASQAILQNAE